jgi:DNA-binding transcriptional MerR regulator
MPSKTLIAAFTEDQVERLTGVSQQQLRYWDRTGFFAPTLAYEDRRAPYSRLYTFRDLVSLKVINALRNDANVPLPHLRKVKVKLAHLGDDVWAKTTLYVLNKRVIFDSPGGETREEIVSGQVILQIPLKVVSGNMEQAIKEMGKRDSGSVGKVERKRNVVHNELVVAGTRIPVRSIKSFADAGYSIDRIRKEYPTLTEGDIRAAIAHKDAAA